jgi:hypothetical protein
MAIAKLSPNDRYAFVGKTGSGKTQQAIVLASHFAQALPYPWEVWWIDTKNEPSDIRQLRKWGFVNGSSEKDMARPGGLRNAKYFMIRGSIETGYETSELAQAKIDEAYQRKHVIIVIDEYTSVVTGRTSAGYALDDVFARGRGRNVGLIGCTQEPVYIPRKLLSQASHIALFTLSYPLDIEYVKKLYRNYTPPQERGDKYGFYWSHVDGSGEWAYYESQAEWGKALRISLPKDNNVTQSRH